MIPPGSPRAIAPRDREPHQEEGADLGRTIIGHIERHHRGSRRAPRGSPPPGCTSSTTSSGSRPRIPYNPAFDMPNDGDGCGSSSS